MFRIGAVALDLWWEGVGDFGLGSRRLGAEADGGGCFGRTVCGAFGDSMLCRGADGERDRVDSPRPVLGAITGDRVELERDTLLSPPA